VVADKLWGFPIVKAVIVYLNDLVTPVDFAHMQNSINDIEQHLHDYEHWYGKLAGGRVATDNTLTPFQAVSGNNTWGTPVQVLDVNDTPYQAGKLRFDPHRVTITDASVTTVYRLRLSVGNTYAAGIAAGTYTSIVVRIAASTRMTPIDIRIPDQVVGTKLWAAIWNATNGATLDFFLGMHDYN
jgi:hypothetical protein